MLELVRANIMHMKESPGLSADYTAPFSLEGLEEIERVCVQNDKLRMALQALVALDDGDEPYWWDDTGNQEVMDEARACLAAIEQTEG